LIPDLTGSNPDHDLNYANISIVSTLWKMVQSLVHAITFTISRAETNLHQRHLDHPLLCTSNSPPALSPQTVIGQQIPSPMGNDRYEVFLSHLDFCFSRQKQASQVNALQF